VFYALVSVGQAELPEACLEAARRQPLNYKRMLQKTPPRKRPDMQERMGLDPVSTLLEGVTPPTHREEAKTMSKSKRLEPCGRCQVWCQWCVHCCWFSPVLHVLVAYRMQVHAYAPAHTNICMTR